MRVRRFESLSLFSKPVAAVDSQEGRTKDDRNADDAGGRDDVIVNDAGQQEGDDLTQCHDDDEYDRA